MVFKLRVTVYVFFFVLLFSPIAFAESTTSVAIAESKTGVAALLGSGETRFFIALNIFLTIWFGHIKFNRFAVAHGPEILTTMGIFGCFIGIALALLNFDPINVMGSVSKLLEGIKTAFWASVSGIGGALYLRARQALTRTPIPQDINNVKAASLDDVVISMNALRAGLVGDEQGTLLTQFKLLRQESKDQLTTLTSSFDNFAKHMVENTQKAIIDALRQVISDFNRNLTEQFGENFKQLNLAVEKLVVWQQQYKEELDLVIKYQQQSSLDFSVASKTLSKIVTEAERFQTIAASLESVLHLLNERKDTLYKQEKDLATVLETMKDVTPTFAEKITEMLTELNAGLSSIQSELAIATKNFGAQAQSSNAEMKNLLAQTLTTAQKEVNESLTENSRVIKEGVLALDKALQHELNSSLETLGRQLASLSQKFVEDYTPLTERLREVVEISRRI